MYTNWWKIQQKNTGTTGLEPATFAVTGRRSNQLIYVPKCCSGPCTNRSELSSIKSSIENPARFEQRILHTRRKIIWTDLTDDTNTADSTGSKATPVCLRQPVMALQGRVLPLHAATLVPPQKLRHSTCTSLLPSSLPCLGPANSPRLH